MRKDKIKSFFEAYEARFNGALKGDVDVEGTSNAFAEYFIEASKVGLNCGKNGEEFRQQIPQGYEFYKSIGTQSMQILGMDITFLDELHSMVKVDWRAIYLKKDGGTESIDFKVIYFLQYHNHAHKIFAYITGDEQGVLRERGLIE